MAVSPRFVPLLVAACLAGCEPAPPRERLDAQALHVQSQQLASLASEAALLTQELAAHHLDTAFAWVHQQALADQARQVAGNLAQPAPAPLQAGQREGMLVAADLQTELTRIAPVQHDEGELQALRARFDELRRRAHALDAGS